MNYAAERLGLPYLSAYLNSLGTSYKHGANFATGGSTIRRQNETIFEYGISPFSLDMQIAQFNQFKARTRDLYQQGKVLKGLTIVEKMYVSIFSSFLRPFLLLTLLGFSIMSRQKIISPYLYFLYGFFFLVQSLCMITA